MSNIQGRKVALVIGNKDYKRSPLKNCINDANDLSSTLSNMGFTVATGKNLNHEDMDKNIESFIQFIQGDDLVVFYFSGHGVQHEGVNYLIPCDDNRVQGLNDLKYRAVNVQRVMDHMLDRKPFAIIYLLDCCRTYSLPNTISARGACLKPGMAAMSVQTGILIAFACAPGATADDEAPNGNNGIFTYHLLKQITRTGEDILDVLRQVGTAVHNGTSGRQMPHMTFALALPRICLASPQPIGAPTVRTIGEKFT